ncbi:MAG: ATP-binding protein, partial [Pseudomonadota bacterium]
VVIAPSLSSFDTMTGMLDVVGLICVAALIGRVIWHFVSHPEENRYFEAAIIILLALLAAVFLINLMIDGRVKPFLELSQPLIMLGLTAGFLMRNFRLFRSTSQINALLQTQLDERTLELEQAHNRQVQLVRRSTVEEERRRIMRDMHDGLGSHLMSLLMMARGGHTKPADYAIGLQNVIDEMRLMIDSMDSVGGSIHAVLALFRKRVVNSARDAGFQVEWHNALTEAVPQLGPRAGLQIFRILQEAVTNSLKHSKGDTIAVHITQDTDRQGAVRIVIADNGDASPKLLETGHGLRNMRHRARSIGADLNLSASKRGVQVALLIK